MVDKTSGGHFSVQIMPAIERNVLSKAQCDILSRLRHLLTSNTPPSSEEDVLISSWRHSFDHAADNVPEDELLRSGADIERMKGILRVQFDRNRSAIHRFPVEVLQDIFHACTYLDNRRPAVHHFFKLGPLTTNPFSLIEAPWVLGHISHKWRSISRSYNPLWLNTLDIDTYEATKRKDPAALFASFLEFMGSTGDVSFNLRMYNLQSWPEDRFLNDYVFKALVDILPRWRDVFIECSSIHLNHLTIGSHVQTPRLREFRLDVPDVLDDHNLTTFAHSPELTHVELTSLLVSSISLPYAHLRSFKDHTRYPFEESPLRALDILRACPRLESLSTDPGHGFDVPTHPLVSPRVVHPSLTSLATTDIGLLQILCLPKLRSLKVRPTTQCEHAINFLPAVCELLRASQCDLRSLEMEDCSTHSLADVLQLTPGLTDLALSFIYQDDPESYSSSMFELLAQTVPVNASGSHIPSQEEMSASMPTHLLIPNLRAFRLYYGFSVSFFDEPFLEMLKSRYRNGLPGGLTSVNIEFMEVILRRTEFMSVGCEYWLKRLRRLGLDLSITRLDRGWKAHRLI